MLDTAFREHHLSVLGGYCVVAEPPVRRLTGWTSERLRGGPMKFALLYFYDPAQAGPAEDEVSDWLALDESKEAGAHVYGAGFHPESTEGGVA
jgi:hypothetical protein